MQPTTSPVARALGLIGVAGAGLFVIGTVIAGLFYPGYSHIDQMISELGGVDAPRAWIQQINFAVCGLAVMGLAIGLMLDRRKAFAPAILLGVFGFATCFAASVVQCDSGCKGATAEGAAHLGLGLLGFVCATVGEFLFVRAWRRDERWEPMVTFGRVCAWATLAGLVLFMASNSTPAIDGLVQRLFVAPLMIFIVGTGWHLAKVNARADAPASERPVTVGV